MKVRTNIMELLLREVLIGKGFYDNNDNLVIIDDINYQPLTNTIFVRSGEDGYRLSINDLYDFELEIPVQDRIIPNKGRLISSIAKNK